MTWFSRLSGMSGRLCLMTEREAECLAKYAGRPGDHVDIGCLWGGTAILAALAKRDAGVDGLVYTIDPMTGGWWNAVDPMVNLQPKPEIVQSNLIKFEVAGLVRVVRSKSQPWPLPDELVITSVLIDGDHAFESVAADWRNASQIATRYILMHDFNSPKHAGITRAYAEVASIDPGWEMIESVDTLAVFGRVVKEVQPDPEVSEPFVPEPVVYKPVPKKTVKRKSR